MRTRLALVASLLLLVPGAALAQEKKEGKDSTTKLPVNPVADAKAGDWSAFVVTQTNDAGEETRAVRRLSVASVGEDGSVNLQSEELGAHGRKKDHRANPFSSKEAPTIEKYFSEEVQDVSAPVDEKLTVDGQSFDCKKISFVSGGGKRSWTVWMSAAAKGSGVVTAKITRGNQTMKLELGGYGTKDKTEWGKTGEELEKGISARKPEEPKKPAETDGLDLSTKEKAAEAILKALRAGDKDTFKKCVTKKILDSIEGRFDAWFEVWKKDAEKEGRNAETFVKQVRLAQEDGAWKLAER